MGEDDFHSKHFGIRHEQCRPYGVYVDDVSPEPLGLVYGSESMDYGLERLSFRAVNVYKFYSVPFRQPVADVVLAPDDCHVKSAPRQPREQLLAVGLDAAHHVWYAACTGYDYLHKELILRENLLFLHRFLLSCTMKRLTIIKETLQYAGVVAISCLSALWLFVIGKGRKR